MGVGYGREVLRAASQYGSAPVQDAIKRARSNPNYLSSLFGVASTGTPGSRPAPPPAGPSRMPRESSTPTPPPSTRSLPSRTTPQVETADLWNQYLGIDEDTPIIYGRSPEGKYAGWNTRSDMQDAIKGWAYQQRDLAQTEAEALLAEAEQAKRDAAVNAANRIISYENRVKQLVPTYGSFGEEGLDAAYNEYFRNTGASNMASLLSKSEFAKMPVGQDFTVQWDDRSEPPPLTPTTDWAEGASGYLAPADETAIQPSTVRRVGYTGSDLWKQAAEKAGFVEDYPGQIAEWQKTQEAEWAPYVDLAVQAQSMSPRDWAIYAATEKYGLSPDVAYGMFDPSYGNAEQLALRDQQYIEQYGMPYAEYQTELRRQADLTEEEQQRYDEAVNSQAGDIVFDAFGGDIEQIASGADLDIDQAFRVLSSERFVDAYSKLTGIDPFTGQTRAEPGLLDPSSGNIDVDNIVEFLSEIQFTDPDVYRLLNEVIPGLLPSGVSSPRYYQS